MVNVSEGSSLCLDGTPYSPFAYAILVTFDDRSSCGRVLEGGDIDDEAIFHLAFYRSFVSLVDLLDRDHLDVGNDIMRGAVIEHFLGFRDASNHGTGNAAASRDQTEGRHSRRFRRKADAYQHPIGKCCNFGGVI